MGLEIGDDNNDDDDDSFTIDEYAHVTGDDDGGLFYGRDELNEDVDGDGICCRDDHTVEHGL